MIKSHGFFGCSNGWLGFAYGDVVREALNTPTASIGSRMLKQARNQQ
jgi:hypothetical protein